MDKPIKLHIDFRDNLQCVFEDDFLVTIGKRKSNSVYHISEVKIRPHKNLVGVLRHDITCYKSNLVVALQRDPSQNLIPAQW